MTDQWQEISETEEEEARRRRRERLARMRREKERRLRLQKIFIVAAPSVVFLIACLVVGLTVHVRKASGKEADGTTGEEQTVVTDTKKVLFEPERGDGVSGEAETPPAEEELSPAPEPVIYSARLTSETEEVSEEVISTNVIFLDLSTGDILAQRDYKAIINPASMTKVLTLLVAAEHVTDLDDTFTITIDITDYSYSNDCSSVGFDVGEVVTVRDLLYGTILPSGG